MKYTGILEKLECIFKLIGNSMMYPIFLGFLALLVLLLITKKLKNKKGIMLMIISYLVLSTIVIINNYNNLGRVFDDIATNLFTNIYFPSAYTYFFVLIIIDIISIKSMFNFKETKAYKIANGICFFVIQFLFVLIMDIVGKNNIDIFTKKSLFSSKNLIILLESSINVFILWIITLLIIYITSKIVEVISIKKSIKELETYPVTDINNTLVVENVEDDNNNVSLENTYAEYVQNILPTDEIPNTTNTTLNITIAHEDEPTTNNSIIEDTFSLNDLIFSKQNTILESNEQVENKVDNNMLLNQFLNNGLPVIHNTEEPVKDQKEEYTLNDYRIFNKILKDIRETNNSNIISINKELELKLINKYTEDEYNLFKVMLKEYSN